MLRRTAGFFVALAIAGPLGAQGNAKLNSRDVVAIVEKTLAFAQDSLLPKSTASQSKVLVDIDLTVSTLRAKSRTPVGTEPVRAIPSRLARGNFFDSWQCPSRSISLYCEMKRDGEFLLVYAVQDNEAGDELVVWVSYSSYRASRDRHVHSFARALKFTRLASGEWRFAGAGPYLAT